MPLLPKYPVLIGSILLGYAEMVAAQVSTDLYYSGHTNSVHDAGSDMKQFGLHLMYLQDSGEQWRLLFEGAALTPPNGRLRPVPDMRVRGQASNQRDTYLYSVGAGKQFFYGPASLFGADFRVGMINGPAETLIRRVIYDLHVAEGMKNLRHSPVSSGRRGLWEIALGNTNIVYRPHRFVALQTAQLLTVGSLETSLVAGMFLILAQDNTRAWGAGLHRVNWKPSGITWYGGYYGKLFHNNLVTEYAGTRKYVPYLQTGLYLPFAQWSASLKFTHYMQPAVIQQFEPTSNYVEFGAGISF